jgi:hypothetical protein
VALAGAPARPAPSAGPSDVPTFHGDPAYTGRVSVRGAGYAAVYAVTEHDLIYAVDAAAASWGRAGAGR